MSELRIDPLTGFEVQVAANRQGRPNLPTGGCPFCVGGTEAPEPYGTLAFANRWPSFPDDRGEVVLYSPQHDATLATLGPVHVRKVVDLWAERTATLGARADIDYVLVFENHGPTVGATISHPHGQIFAFDRIPALPALELAHLAAGQPLLEDDPEGVRVVAEHHGWRAWVPYAAAYPHQVRVAPLELVPDLPALDGNQRDGLAYMLVDVLHRFEHRFPNAMPYMLWWHQRPTDGGDWPAAWLHLEINGPWRADGVMRFVAAGELGSGSFINPVLPEDAAAALRAVGSDEGAGAVVGQGDDQS